jgi:hypothetical protein
VDAVVGGDDVAGVVAVPLDALLHAAALRRAPVVVPARARAKKARQRFRIERVINMSSLSSLHHSNVMGN